MAIDIQITSPAAGKVPGGGTFLATATVTSDNAQVNARAWVVDPDGLVRFAKAQALSHGNWVFLFKRLKVADSAGKVMHYLLAASARNGNNELDKDARSIQCVQ